MPIRSRVAWGQALVRGVREADVVHFLNPHLPGNRPRPVPAPARTVTAYCSSSLAILDGLWELPPAREPQFAVFVGTNVMRKRIALITLMARKAGIPVTLVGHGTEACRGQPFVTALGRVDDGQLSTELNESSALLLVSEYEGFRIPVLEAAARGLVSVVSPEVYATLPPLLREHVVATDPSNAATFARTVRTAFACRGIARFNGASLLDPLLDVYAEALAR
jgi:glycosyltransferase involved in cell wall biosynthesis